MAWNALDTAKAILEMFFQILTHGLLITFGKCGKVGFFAKRGQHSVLFCELSARLTSKNVDTELKYLPKPSFFVL